MSESCDTCADLGFALFARDNNPNDMEIQKCDLCATFKTDSEAQTKAHEMAVRSVQTDYTLQELADAIRGYFENPCRMEKDRLIEALDECPGGNSSSG